MPDLLRLPDDWEILDEPPQGTVLVAREPEEPADPARFRANVVVTALSTGGLGFRDWQTGTEELLAKILDDYLVVDLERILVDGVAGGRRLAHHGGPADEALTMEQWFVLLDGVGHTLTATVETLRYDELADRCAAIAGSWRPTEAAGHAG